MDRQTPLIHFIMSSPYIGREHNNIIHISIFLGNVDTLTLIDHLHGCLFTSLQEDFVGIKYVIYIS